MTLAFPFLSYQNQSFDAIERLDRELRHRGAVPWVDRLPHGFTAGDDCEQEARRVLREEATCMVLYLTDEVLTSDFIQDIEIPEAHDRLKTDPHFRLVVASPIFRFSKIKEFAKKTFGIDLSAKHGFARYADESTELFLMRVADEVINLQKGVLDPRAESVSISVNTYERMPHSDDVFYFDATVDLDGDVRKSEVWDSLLTGMQVAKRLLSSQVGRPLVHVHGSKHLTAAFMTGRVFNQFPLSIRQKDDYWKSTGSTVAVPSLSIHYAPGPITHRDLIVEISTGHKAVAVGVDVLLERTGMKPGGRLQIAPLDGRIDVNDELSRSVAQIAYSEIDIVAGRRRFERIHLFPSAPQSTVMTLGTLFQGAPDVLMYEWVDGEYVHSATVPSRLR